MHHGYWSYCSGGQCQVCNTPWPEKLESPTVSYLKTTDYFSKYRKVFFSDNSNDGLSHVGGSFTGGWLELPQGLTGDEILKIRKQLNEDYKKIEGKSGGIEECKKRGALEGYELDKTK